MANDYLSINDRVIAVVRKLADFEPVFDNEYGHSVCVLCGGSDAGYKVTSVVHDSECAYLRAVELMTVINVA